MNIGEEIELEIEKLTNTGLGLAHFGAIVVFIPNVCPQDVARVKITKITKNYIEATPVEIIKSSSHRVKPFCPMQKVCGSCQIQFIDYEYQLELKRQIVKETMYKIGGIENEISEVTASPTIKNYRHKIQYPISQTKNSKRILAGYYKPSSHEIVNIKYCPIQPEICDTIIDFIRTKAFDYGINGYEEKKHKGDLRHVVIRHSSTIAENLVVLVVNATKSFDRLNDFAQAIYDNFEKVTGVCINYNSKKTNVIMGNRTELVCGKDYIKEKILGKTFKIGAQTFFQVNPKSAENIFKYVKDYIQSNLRNAQILDAYAGISVFGIIVSDVCKQVVTIEENLESVKLAQECTKLNDIKNIEIHGGDAGEFFKKEKRKFDAIILDPPRKGCSEESLKNSLRLCNNTIIYVSCNPATLARDLRFLKDNGCKIESIKPFDMFCHTYHIENVAIIKVPTNKN